MATCVRVFLLVLGFTPVTPLGAWAQLDPRIAPGPRRVDVSGTGGFLVSTDWSDLVLLVQSRRPAARSSNCSCAISSLSQVLCLMLRSLIGRGATACARTAASRGRVSRSLAVAAISPRSRWSSSVDVDTYLYDIAGVIGMMDYRPRAWVWPYIFFGVGGITYNLEQGVSPPLTFIERRRTVDGQTLIVRESPDQLLIAIDELGVETQLALNLGVGADFRIPMGPASLGVRFEAGITSIVRQSFRC